MWRIVVATVANAVLVWGPAAAASSGEALWQPEFLAAIGGLSLAMLVELAAQSPRRALTAGHADADRFGARFNLLQGVTLLVAMESLAVVAATDHHRPEAPMVTTGLVVLATAAVLRWWAIRHLGPGFTDGFHPAGPILRTGPYRWLRHPAELGLLLCPIGFAVELGVGDWLALAWPPLLALSAVRIWYEEHGFHRTAYLTELTQAHVPTVE